MADELAVRVRLIDARTAQLEAQRTERAISKIGTSSKTAGGHAKEGARGFSVFGGALRGLKYAAGITGIGGLAFGIRDAIQAGQQWQQQQAQLQQALRNTGQASSNMAQLNKAIEQASTRGGFSLQEETQGMAQFIRLTGNATQAMKLNTAAANLARGAHLEYGQAVRMISQIQTGNTGRLQRYIGILQPVTSHVQALTAAQRKANPEALKQAQLLDKQATAAMATQRIMKMYGGATSAYSHTAAGALSNARHSFELLAEQLGKTFLPLVSKAAQWLATLAPKIGSVFQAAIHWISGAVHWLKQHKTITTFLITLTGTLLGGMLAFRAVVKVINMVKAAQLALNLVMDANPIGLVIVAVAALAAGFITLYKRSETFRRIVQGVFEGIKRVVMAVVGFVRQHWQLMLAVMTGGIGLAVLFVVKHFNEIKHVIGVVVGWITDKFKKLAAIITAPFRAVGSVIGTIGSAVGSIFHTGGVVKPRHFAAGGVTGMVPGVGSSDTVPASLTPGEFVLRKQVVSAIGVPQLNAMNSGAAPDSGPGVLELHTHLMVGSRQLAEAVTHYQLKRAARA